MSVFLVGLITLILVVVPFIFVKCSIKTLARISFLVLALLLLPHLLLHQSFFSIEIMENELFSFSDCLSLSIIALFPLAVKSTILLYNHEMRLFNYVRNIAVFLFVALIDDFIRVFHMLEKFFDYGSGVVFK